MHPIGIAGDNPEPSGKVVRIERRERPENEDPTPIKHDLLGEGTVYPLANWNVDSSLTNNELSMTEVSFFSTHESSGQLNLIQLFW